ncbi:MAG: sel1 repeat family protein [Deltaproteobacteria bacterium]|nr:sel1 repeat family protein [Deltaproteobacteria bacterium]
MTVKIDPKQRLRDIEKTIFSGNFARAHKLLKPLLLQKNAEAYFFSSSISKHKESIRAFEKRHVAELTESADLGYPRAIYGLGACYDCGDFVPQDKQKASALFKRAADLGHVHSQWIHGVELLYGLGSFRKNQRAGARYLIRAAEGKHKYALEILAECHAKGTNGFPRDPKLSKRYSTAARKAKAFWERDDT